ncbi:MAG: hypothetical protein FJ086_04925 [Deltaproteobacteria bacterium]|nr:hypothetical protein [Deltaproteobacteria bacterium]
MTTRTRLIEGTWSCTSCGGKDIPGRYKACPTCNNPREEGKESTFDFGATDAATGKSLREGVTDEKAAALGALGADWYCPYCAAGNREDAEKCKNCQAPKPENPPRAPPPPKAPPAPPPKSGKGKLVVGLVLLGLFGVCGLMFRTSASGGKVVAQAWEQKVERQRFEQVEELGWRDELSERPTVMPTNGAGEQAGISNIRECSEQRRGDKRIPDGTERVCETKTKRAQCGTEERCTRKDKGNGFAEETCTDVPKYCDEPYESCVLRTRYRTVPDLQLRCRYATWKWVTQDEQVLSGKDGAPRWPQLQAGANERLQRTGTYAVEVAWGKDGSERHVLKPSSEAEFTRFQPGQAVTVTSNGLGAVTDVKPAP